MKKLGIFILSLGLLAACNQDSSFFEKMHDFDQEPLLKNLGENLIVPAYQNLAQQSSELEAAITLLIESPSSENLVSARVSLKATRMAWQSCSPYQFGPAETHALSSSLNIYPVDQNRIERNITEGNYDLSTLANQDAKGFQTIGYLLYSKDKSDEDILASLVGSRAAYLVDVVAQVTQKSAVVFEDWSKSGGYLEQFTSEDAFGVNVGSSVGNLVNAMIESFEIPFRYGKIGTPSGIRTNGESIPTSIEAYYSGYSVELIHASIDAYYQLYQGKVGDGIDDYLKAIQSTTISNEDLSLKIDTQFKALIAASNGLSEPFSVQIENDPEGAIALVFSEIQALIVLFKTEMVSSLGVVITYQDNDGD